MCLNLSFAKEIIFDLDNQDFINSLGNQQLNAKYNVDDKVIIETNLLKNDQGIYHTNANTIGNFSIIPSRQMYDWKVNVDVQYEGFKNKNRMIKFTDVNGEVILFEFHVAGFIVNSVDFKANIDKKHLIIQIVRQDDKVHFYLNKQLIESQKVEFGMLKSIETTIYKFSVYEQDKLNNILLVSSD